MAAKPLDVLNENLNERVIVELRGRREYRGELDGYDHPHMNIVLKNAEEINDKGTDQESKQSWDRVIIRGDNIIYISP